jgi:histone-lysine N-methyltransferase SETMAR
MEKRDIRLLMNYDFRSGLSATECHHRLKTAYPDLKVSYETVRTWYGRFRNGNESLSDRDRCGRPKTAVTEENVEKVRDLIESDPRISYDSLQCQLGIGRLSIETILHEHLHVKKVTAKFVPHVLTDIQKCARVEWCQTMLSKFNNGSSPMVWDIVTGDETWVRQRDARSVTGRQVWCYEGEEPVPEVRPSSWVGKQMVATFFSKGGHLVTVAVEHQRTVTAKWYTEVCLTAVLEAWSNRRPNDGFRHLRLHHDNAPAHTAILTTDFLYEKGIRIVSHPAYSPDLAPADFFLFGMVKEKLRGIEFASAQEAVQVYEDEVNKIPRKVWNSAFNNWFTRMSDCVNNHGNYVD